jgi:HEAT repeat protein
MKTIKNLCSASLTFLWYVGTVVTAQVENCWAQPLEAETPAALVQRLPKNSSARPADRELEEKIIRFGTRALPALEQELHLGINFKELNALLRADGSRRAAVVRVLTQIPGEQSTDLLLRSLADPPDNYGMRYATLKALAGRTVSRSQTLALLRNCHPEVASAGIVHATRAAASPEIQAALETLFDQDAARKQFKNEYGAAIASEDVVWEIHLAAGRALKKDMLPEIRSKTLQILAGLKAESLHPTRPDEPVGMGFLSEAESTIGRHLSRLAAFGEPIKDLVERTSVSAEGDYAKVLDMALVRLGDPARVGRVATYLIESPSPTIRSCAAITLRLSGDRSAIPALKKALRDPYQRKDGSDVGPRDRLVYPIRVLAADALIDLGENPKKVRESMRPK